MDPHPEPWINPVDAVDRAIGAGDSVEMFNDRGRAEAHAKVTEAARPGLDAHGWVAVNKPTSNAPCLTPEASEILSIPGGEASYEALIDVRRTE